MTNKISILLCTFILLIGVTVTAQSSVATSSRAEKFKRVESRLIYPLLQAGLTSGVLPVDNITNKPANGTRIKLIFDFTQSTANNAQATNLNEGLQEVARVMNLHIAAGIKKENLSTVIIFHSTAIHSILNDIFYQQKYGSVNPNRELLTKIEATGTELVVCGQSLQFMEIDHQFLLPVIQVAMSAKTTLSKYQQKGYSLIEVSGAH